jgi:hypothetical protein
VSCDFHEAYTDQLQRLHRILMLFLLRREHRSSDVGSDSLSSGSKNHNSLIRRFIPGSFQSSVFHRKGSGRGTADEEIATAKQENVSSKGLSTKIQVSLALSLPHSNIPIRYRL